MENKATTPVLRKPVEALVMVPTTGKLTVTSRKLYNVILHATQQQSAEFKALEGKEITASHSFEARLCDLLDPIEVGKSNLGEIGKNCFREMVKTAVEWESTDKNNARNWETSALLSGAKIVFPSNKNAALLVQWTFSQAILDALIKPDMYAQLSIYQIAKLTSYETLVLYEICTRYRSISHHLTNKSDPEWWVRALSNKVPALDPVTKKPKLRPWPKFKDDKIKKAIAEINEKTDLDIELIEHKQGRTIVDVQFKVICKEPKLLENISKSQQIKVSPEIAELAAKAGLSLSEVSSVMATVVDESVLKFGLLKLEERIERQDLQPIDFKLAYLKSVLTDSDQYITTAPPAKPAPAPVAPQAPLTTKGQKRADFKAEYLLLSKEAQQPYAIQALEALKATGAKHPSLARAIQSGEWIKNNLLMSKIVEIYAIATRGPDWHNDPAK